MGLIDNINKLFDHRIRLGIMSVLMVNEEVDFNRLKELLKPDRWQPGESFKNTGKSRIPEYRKEFYRPQTQYTL